eukprot:gene10034-2208_t
MRLALQYSFLRELENSPDNNRRVERNFFKSLENAEVVICAFGSANGFLTTSKVSERVKEEVEVEVEAETVKSVVVCCRLWLMKKELSPKYPVEHIDVSFTFLACNLLAFNVFEFLQTSIVSMCYVRSAERHFYRPFLGLCNGERTIVSNSALVHQICFWRMGATLFVQPLDLIKNRMQVASGRVTFLSTVTSIVKSEGVLAIYNGLSAGLLRQATYTTTRLGVYNILLDRFSNKGSTELSFVKKASIGLTAGSIGAVVGTPAEVALVRMSADGSRPIGERRGYTSVFNAIFRISREEGITTLWRGCAPTVARAMVVNAAQLATYTQAKEFIYRHWKLDGILLHFTASMVSGLATTAASMPVDILKTRIQNMRTVDGVAEFKSPVHVASHIIRNEGVLSLWRGFFPYYARLGPHTVLTFIILEQLNQLYLSLQ